MVFLEVEVIGKEIMVVWNRDLIVGAGKGDSSTSFAGAWV